MPHVVSFVESSVRRDVVLNLIVLCKGDGLNESAYLAIGIDGAAALLKSTSLAQCPANGPLQPSSSTPASTA
jgi:hypothetical protein